MTTGDKNTLAWLRHRAGIHKLDHHPSLVFQRNLEGNLHGQDFVASFGRKDIRGCVGFVDIAGFSERVSSLSPREIGEYLRPFLVSVVEEVLKADGLIDKTIGDEVMFVIPDMKTDGGMSAVDNLRYVLILLQRLQEKLGPNYPFHVGIAYGDLYIDCVGGKGYEEWTLAGRSVILAKRLTECEVSRDASFKVTFGVLRNECSDKEFRSILRQVAGELWDFDHAIIEKPLKGVSDSECATIFRRPR